MRQCIEILMIGNNLSGRIYIIKINSTIKLLYRISLLSNAPYVLADEFKNISSLLRKISRFMEFVKKRFPYETFASAFLTRENI